MDLIDYYLQGYEFPSSNNNHFQNIKILENTLMYSSDYKTLIYNTDIIGSLYSRKGEDGLFFSYMGGNLISKMDNNGIKNISLNKYVNYTIKYVIYVPENTTNIIKAVQDRLDSIYGKNKFEVTLEGSIDDFYNETYMYNPSKKPSDYYPSSNEMVSDFQNKECDKYYNGEKPTNYYKININGVDYKFIVLRDDSKVQSKTPIEFKNAVNNTSIVVNNPRIAKGLYNGSKIYTSQDPADTEFTTYFVDEGTNVSIKLGDLDYDYAYSYNISLIPESVSLSNLLLYTDNMFKLPLPDSLKNQNFEIRELSYDNSKMKVTSKPIEYKIENNSIIINSKNLGGLYGIRLIEKIQSIKYTTHVQSYGWQKYVKNGEMAGTSGEAKRLEGIKIKLENQEYSGDVEYRTHVQSYGWQEYVKNDEMSGTSGEAKRLEAIQIRLTGEMAEHYDIYYRVHAQSYGWLGWAKNDELSGTAGLAKRLEGIEIQLVEKGGSPKENEHQNDNLPYYTKLVEYTTHVQSYGWQMYSYDGGMAGTSGEAKRLEGIRIHLSNQKYSGDIEYRTHVQSYGWQEYVKNDEMSGTEGEAKRLEAIQIRLTGEMAEHYDIYYRVHAQSYGWLGWAKNDEKAGTAGFAKRLEGIEIQLVEKGKSPKENEHQNDNLPFYE